ncbi:hypothetical protein AMS68_005306 [Peltaster fructicola]|uniref:Thioredoxin domain-containing protein n=1 Tax=Peltaster fructicola TaxID=286661 RepID=A0A6H0XYU0_9PEZI|nr:hypothetical protein AMS68_005306 [Peltaster fructicola]
MKLSLSLVGFLLPLSTIAAKAPKAERYDDFHAKQISSSGSPLKLNDRTYDELTKAPRDYSVAVLLTALDARFGCALCHDFQPEWDALSKSWIKGDKAGESRLLYGTLDFTDGKETFQKLQLQTAPVLYLFHPTTGPHAKTENNPTRFDFASGLNKAEPIHAFISRSLPDRPHPPFVRPFNYMRVALVVTVFLGIVSALVVAAPYILPLLQSRNLWAAISLILILLFTSGYMYNYIRNSPYVAGDGKGKISYFVGGFQNQTGLETQILAAIYGLLSFATISLALKVPRMANPRQQQIAVLVWSGVILGVYSFLLSVFRIKNGGYPFWLPPF